MKSIILVIGILVGMVSQIASAEIFVVYTLKAQPGMQGEAIAALNQIQDYERKKWGHTPITLTPGDGDVEASLMSLDRHKSMGEYEEVNKGRSADENWGKLYTNMQSYVEPGSLNVRFFNIEYSPK
jgi:hypothetical protein